VPARSGGNVPVTRNSTGSRWSLSVASYGVVRTMPYPSFMRSYLPELQVGSS
jgi:hypothetical protein